MSSVDTTSPPTRRPDPAPTGYTVGPAGRHLVWPVATAALVLAVLLPPLARSTAIAVLAVLGATGLVLVARRLLAAGGPRAAVELLLHLSPVIILAIAFPLATGRIEQVRVDGVGLTELVLASSLTVPWLSQAVCLPLYRAIGHLMQEGDLDRIGRRFVEVWPATLAQSLPVVVLFAVPVELAMRWSWQPLLAYLVLCALHTVFVQSLIIANVGRLRGRWALAWTAYAAALLVAPELWFLPPIAGLVTQLWPLRRHLGALRHPAVTDVRDVAADLGRGLLLGSVLWADKLFLFLRSGTGFEVSTVFLALLPAVLAYNIYFVRLAPTFDRRVLQVRDAMEHAGFDRLGERSRALTAAVTATMGRTLLIGAVLAVAVTAAFTAAGSRSVWLVVWVAVASCLFVLTTVACYKLDYIGRRGTAQVLSAVHLAGCAAILLLTGPVTTGYALLTVLEAPLAVTAVLLCRANWKASPYTLFWRHATAW